jgi:hypothetical protein
MQQVSSESARAHRIAEAPPIKRHIAAFTRHDDD